MSGQELKIPPATDATPVVKWLDASCLQCLNSERPYLVFYRDAPAAQNTSRTDFVFYRDVPRAQNTSGTDATPVVNKWLNASRLHPSDIHCTVQLNCSNSDSEKRPNKVWWRPNWWATLKTKIPQNATALTKHWYWMQISVLSIETGDTHAVLVLVVLVQLPEYAIPPKRRTSSLPISQGGSSNSIKNNAEKLPGLKSTR